MTLTVLDPISNAMAELENANKFVGSLMKIPHYQKMGVDILHLICAKARSLNIDPLYALNGALYNVKGKIGMGAETMAAMIREKGHSIVKDKASNDNVCILHGKRADTGDTWTTSFSIADAQRAGIMGDTWKKYPSIMCYNRAMSMLARQLFPDVIKGCGYTPDELQEIGRSRGGEQDIPSVGFEEIKPEVLTITPGQAIELKALIEMCGPEYQAQITKTFANFNPPIKEMQDVPADLYDRLHKAASKKAQEYAETIQKYKDEPTQVEGVNNVA